MHRIILILFIVEVNLSGGYHPNNIIDIGMNSGTIMKACGCQVTVRLVGHSHEHQNPRIFIGGVDIVFGYEEKCASLIQFILIKNIVNNICANCGCIKDKSDVPDPR